MEESRQSHADMSLHETNVSIKYSKTHRGHMANQAPSNTMYSGHWTIYMKKVTARSVEYSNAKFNWKQK